MAKVTIKLSGDEDSFETDTNTTILEAAQDAGIATPFGCTSGSCHVCVAKVTSGEVDRGGIFDTLDQDMKDKGIILTCQAKCKSDAVEIDFDAI
jgi:ferredoxin